MSEHGQQGIATTAQSFAFESLKHLDTRAQRQLQLLQAAFVFLLQELAGGDKRGMQAASMVIVKKGGGVWLNNDTVLRFQVDDQENPFKEMRRVVENWNKSRGRGPVKPGQQ